MKNKAGKFDVCADCGANLDTGEKCDCDEEINQQDKPVEQKTA